MAAKILELLIPILLGLGFRTAGVFGDDEGRHFKRLVVYLCIPLLVFFALKNAPREDISAAPVMILALGAVTAALFAVGYLASLTVRGAARRTAVHACVTYGNYGWLGYGAAYVLQGDPGFRRVVFFLMLWYPVFYGGGLLIGWLHHRDRRAHIPWGPALAASLPALAGLVAGLLFNVMAWELPEVLSGALRPFSAMTIPLILFGVGVALDVRGVGRNLGPAALISAITLILAPGAAWALTAAASPDPVSTGVIVLLAGMPVAVGIPLLTEVADLDLDVAHAAIVVSTLLSGLTLPAVVYLLGG